MPLASRDRNHPGTAFVLLLVVSVFLFAIYLKASPVVPESLGSSTSHVKLWTAPNQDLDSRIKLIPLGFIVLLSVGFCQRHTDGPVERVLNFGAAAPNIRTRVPNRFRPPPQN